MVINRLSAVPVYEQLIAGVEQEILSGLMPEGQQIPSIRELSAAFCVNPNTIQKSYLELARRGELVASQGNGYYVSVGARDVICKREAEKLAELEKIAARLKFVGVSEETVLTAVRRIYKEEKND